MVRLNEIEMQDGRIFLITGANSGLGFETSKFLLARGATVIMCCRDLIKGEKAKQELLKLNFKSFCVALSPLIKSLQHMITVAPLSKRDFDVS